MTTRYGAYDGYDVMYDKNGALVDPAAQQALIDYLKSNAAAGITDLAVMSHGWNNNTDEAKDLYRGFFIAMGTALADPHLGWPASRKFAVMAIFWPSKKF